MDVKLQLMQDIAAEYGLEWNSKALQQRLYEQEHADVASNNKKSKDAHHIESRDDDSVENANSEQKSLRMKHLDQSGHKDSGHKPNGEISSHRNREGPPGRTTSLPIELEQITPEELMKGHSRAKSYTPDMFGHVHPRVPNYEEVVARLTDLGGKSKE